MLSPMSDLDHVTEIGRVLDGCATGRDAVVSESWRRCVESYGMEPGRDDPAHIVTDAELRAHRDQAEHLIATARSGLQALFRQVAGQNYVLLLTDAAGICVDFFGDPRFAEELRQAGLHLGSDWSESLAGTCGVGACLYTGQPVTIHQGDHFGMAHTPLSCTAAPIHDSVGRLAAVLDISLLRAPAPKSSQNLAMNLVTTAARRVEMANVMTRSRREWVLRVAARPEFLEVDPEAAVVLDGSGRITGFTRAAQDLLGDGTPEALLGQRIDAVTDLSVDDLPDLMRGRPPEDRVIRLKDGRGLFGHAIAPQIARMPRRARAGLPAALSAIAGPDPAMDALLDRTMRLAPTSVPLLIAGETGTGKSRLARAIHTAGRPGTPFVDLDAAGLTPEALGAALPAADIPATLFLRGVEDLSADLQARLPAILDARPALRPLSSVRSDPAGALRDAVFYRLAGARIDLPPLRLRQDFDWLLDRLLRRRTAATPRISAAARDALGSRAWPGNIRELERTLDTALALSTGPALDVADLPAAASAPHAAREDLEAVLDACEWNMARAARRLGLNRSTVLRRVRKAGLAPPA